MKLIVTFLFICVSNTYGFTNNPYHLIHIISIDASFKNCKILIDHSHSLQYYGNIYFRYQTYYYAITYPLEESSKIYRLIIKEIIDPKSGKPVTIHEFVALSQLKLHDSDELSHSLKKSSGYKINESDLEVHDLDMHSFNCDKEEDKFSYTYSENSTIKTTNFNLNDITFYKPSFGNPEKWEYAMKKSLFVFSAYDKVVKTCSELITYLNKTSKNKAIYFKYKDSFYKTYSDEQSPLFKYNIQEHENEENYFKKITLSIPTPDNYLSQEQSDSTLHSKNLTVIYRDYEARFLGCNPNTNELDFIWKDNKQNQEIKNLPLKELNFYSNKDDPTYFLSSRITPEILKNNVNNYYMISLTNCNDFNTFQSTNKNTIERKIFLLYNNNFYFYFPFGTTALLYKSFTNTLQEQYWRIFDKIYYKPICEEINNEPTLVFNTIQDFFKDNLLIKLNKVKFYKEKHEKYLLEDIELPNKDGFNL